MTNSTNMKPEPQLLASELLKLTDNELFGFIQKQNFKSRKEMNDFLEKHFPDRVPNGIFPVKRPRKTNEEKSDDLIYQAFNSKKKGVNLAKEALRLNPSNIMALNFLGDNAESAEEALQLYKTAMDYGKVQLGDDYFIKNKGQLWEKFESKQFMTAKFGYADCLSTIGKLEESIAEFQELLILNPTDNQNVRYILGGILLRQKHYSEFLALYQQFEAEHSTILLYNYALCLFLKGGASPKANLILREAYKSNKHVLRIMTGKEKAIENVKDTYNPGDEDEATEYLRGNFNLWNEHPKAFGWILQFMASLKR